MPEQDTIAPNIPDVQPDYIDLDDVTAPSPPPNRRASSPAAASAQLRETAENVAVAVIDPPQPVRPAIQPVAETRRETPSPIPVLPHPLPVSTTPYPTPPPQPAVSEIPPPPPPARQTAAPGVESRHREGECIPNIPDVAPQMVTRPAPGVDPDAERLAGRSRPGLAIPSWLKWTYFGATLLITAVFGLFLSSQTISALAMAQNLPGWAQFFLLVPLALCGLVVLGVCVSLVWTWVRLNTFQQVNIPEIDELQRRAESRKDGLEHFQAARLSLEKYLNDYPLADATAKRLQNAGLPDDVRKQLAEERPRLLKKSTDSKSWLNDFQRLVQTPLDQAAAKRVNSWSLKAAGCVIASPLPLLDAILILGISYKMIQDLATIYNLRASGMATLILLTRGIRNAFIAGVGEDVTVGAGNMLGDQMAGVLGTGALGTLGSSMTRVVAPKLGEGAINGLFMRRLGKATIRMLQPLRGN